MTNEFSTIQDFQPLESLDYWLGCRFSPAFRSVIIDTYHITSIEDLVIKLRNDQNLIKLVPIIDYRKFKKALSKIPMEGNENQAESNVLQPSEEVQAKDVDSIANWINEEMREIEEEEEGGIVEGGWLFPCAQGFFTQAEEPSAKQEHITTPISLQRSKSFLSFHENDAQADMEVQAQQQPADLDRLANSTNQMYYSAWSVNDSIGSSQNKSQILERSEKFLQLVEKGVREQMERKEAERRETHRRKHIEKTQEQLQTSWSADICFLLDCTGSMQQYIQQLGDKILFLCQELRGKYPALRIRLAFVGYRDYVDEEGQSVVLDFTEHLEDFQCVVKSQRAQGGGDEAEDVMGGLNKVKSLSWASATRILFHIADAPCHGVQYHAGQSTDNFPDGDPQGLSPDRILPALIKMSIKYIFTRITGKTDLMIDKFNQTAVGYMQNKPNPASEYISVVTVDQMNIMNLLTGMASSLLWSTTMMTSRTSEGSKRLNSVQKDIQICEQFPHFSSVPGEGVMVFYMIPPKCVETLLKESTDQCVELFSSTQLSLKIASTPFARGQEKVAYYAKIVKDNNEGKEWYVCKDLLQGEARYRQKRHYERMLVSQRTARFLGQEFCKRRPKSCATVEFIEASIIQLNTRWPEQPFRILEKMIGEQDRHGESAMYEKYNTNNGAVNVNPTIRGTKHDAVQAFSHFTYCVTDANLLVADCQGVYDKDSNAFLLTDPAVHCRQLLRYGRTNLGEKGFELFFSSHRCNRYCKEMNLFSPTTGAN